MKKISTLLVAAGLLTSVGSASAQLRIPIQEEKPVEMYALGANNTKGVFKINLTDLENPTQLNGTTYTQYTGGTKASGGTFLNPETVVGVYYGTSYYYTYEATAAGKDGEPWAENYFKSSSTILYGVYDMTYDEQNDIIYCWYGLSYGGALGIYDPATQTITRVGNATNTYMRAIAIDKDGQLWGAGSYGLIFKIDKTTGVCTDLTNFTGCGIQFDANTPMSAAFDNASGVMYLVGKDGAYSTYGSLYKIDVNTLKAERVGNFANAKYYNCLYIAGSTIAAGAPAPVEDLAATFNGEATVVSFTAPTVDTSGKNLSGDLTYSIAVDGDEVATGSIQPGLTATVNINPTDGQHEISVTVSNNDGTSKAVKTSVYSGYDQPGAVTNLKAVADGDDVTLTWDAPTGKNGGTVDMSKLTYTISCNGTTIVTGVTTNTYATTFDGYYAENAYTVTVVYNETAGESATASLMGGNAYPVPYSVKFSDVTSLGAAGFTILDPNTGNYFASGTWKLESSNLTNFSDNSFCRTDYAYLPKISLKAGVPYQISFAAMITTVSYVTDKNCNLSVLIAKEPTSVAADYTVLKDYTIPVVRGEMNWEDYTVDFTVDADGDYFLGILDYAANSREAYHYLYVKEMSVVANIPTPAAVEDLAATPQADNNRNIELTFTLPTKDTKGADLTSITAVEIYRGTELLETIEGDLTPGKAMTYTDENAPRGFKSYSVVVLNGDNASAKATVSVMVGYLNNLAVELVAAPEGAVKPNGGGVITVKVTNDGFETVLDGAYEVVLYCNGAKVDSQTGTTLAMDATKDYSFTLNWTGSTPQTVEYVVKVEFNGDEKLADNETAPIAVSFQSTSGVDDTVCAGLEVIAANGKITVKGAEGMTVTVYAADGRTIAAATAGAEYTTAALPRGAYIVCVGTTAVKVAL